MNLHFWNALLDNTEFFKGQKLAIYCTDSFWDKLQQHPRIKELALDRINNSTYNGLEFESCWVDEAEHFKGEE